MLSILQHLIDFVLHVDKHLIDIVSEYHSWTYLILFLIIFCETGLVVTPFLPGDSLLFAAGAICAIPETPLDVNFMALIMIIAAITGDNTNYWIGRRLGDTIYRRNFKLVKREYIDRTHEFYEKYGKTTIIIARFMPIIRTFAPFVAGIGKMQYLRFFTFSMIGNILWVCIFIYSGNFFGNIPSVRHNFTVVVFAIIGISVIPPIFSFIRMRYFQKK